MHLNSDVQTGKAASFFTQTLVMRFLYEDIFTWEATSTGIKHIFIEKQANRKVAWPSK